MNEYPCPDCSGGMQALHPYPAGYPNMFHCEHCKAWWHYDGATFDTKHVMEEWCPDCQSKMRYMGGLPGEHVTFDCSVCRTTWHYEGDQEPWRELWPARALGEKCPKCQHGPMRMVKNCLCGNHITYECRSCHTQWKTVPTLTGVTLEAIPPKEEQAG